MKLVTLNCWGGRAAGKLLPFLAERGRDVDVFCFQEVFDADQRHLDERHPGEGLRGDLLRSIRDVLPDHMGCFAYFDDEPRRMSLAFFVRHGIRVRTLADFIVYRPAAPKETGSAVIAPRKLQYAVLDHGGRDVTVANFHGLWVNGPKTDTPERLDQARLVRAFLDGVAGPKVLCGDFNLLPDTSSLAIMKEGMRELVGESGAKGTRTSLYRHYENPAEPNFADYVIVSPEVDVKEFSVLPDVVSDHAPLYVEFR